MTINMVIQGRNIRLISSSTLARFSSLSPTAPATAYRFSMPPVKLAVHVPKDWGICCSPRGPAKHLYTTTMPIQILRVVHRNTASSLGPIFTIFLKSHCTAIQNTMKGTMYSRILLLMELTALLLKDHTPKVLQHTTIRNTIMTGGRNL